jgi:hypothetical protein
MKIDRMSEPVTKISSFGKYVHGEKMEEYEKKCHHLGNKPSQA